MNLRWTQLLLPLALVCGLSSVVNTPHAQAQEAAQPEDGADAKKDAKSKDGPVEGEVVDEEDDKKDPKKKA